MDEKDINLEQPTQNLVKAHGKEILQEEEIGENLKDEGGSKLGKFKDAEALMFAYNNLQSDYTKKCQALSSLQKQVAENESKLSPEQKFAQTKLEAQKFFEADPIASEHIEEITKIAMQFDGQISSDNMFESAWSEYAKKNFVSKKTLANDPSFLQEYIFNNKQIKEKIVKEYFNSLNFASSPTLISAQKGANMVLAPQSKPKTIKDATKLVEDMFD